MIGLIGRVGSLFTKLPKPGGLLPGVRTSATTRPGRVWQNILGADKTSVGVGALLYGSNKAQEFLGRTGLIPTREDISRMSEGVAKQGRNYTVGGIEYDFRTGRPINAPPSMFTPYPEDTLQAGQLTNPPFQPPVAPPALDGQVRLSNGAGVPAQRQNVKERQLSQDVLNAAQQYAAPAGVPLSSFYAGQQQLGRSMEQGGELQRRLKELGGSAGMSDKALMDWAKQNPGLAYRELLKLQNRNQQI